MWWVDLGQEIHFPFATTYSPSSLSFNGDTTAITAAGSDGVYRMELRNPSSSERIFLASGRVQSIVSSSDGIFALIGGSLRFWNAKTHVVEEGGSRNDFTSVRVDDAKPQYFMTTSQNGSIQLWQTGRDLPTNQISTRTGCSQENSRSFPINPIGSPVSFQPGSADTRSISPSSIVSAEFSSDGKSVVVVTTGWAHLLSVTDTGLKPVGSRALRFTAHVRNRIHFPNESGSRLVIQTSMSNVNGIEVVDFSAETPGSARSLLCPEDWEKKVGLRLEQGSVLSR